MARRNNFGSNLNSKMAADSHDAFVKKNLKRAFPEVMARSIFSLEIFRGGGGVHKRGW